MSKDQFIKCCQSFFRFIFLNLYYLLETIIKIVIQMFEFYTMIILTNIILGYNIIFSTPIVEEKSFLIIFSFIFNVMFSYISSNFLTIYYYELCQLSWFKYDNINESIEPDIYKPKNKSNDYSKLNILSTDEEKELIKKGSFKVKPKQFSKENELSYKAIIISLMVLLYIFGKGDIYDLIYVLFLFHPSLVKVGKIYSAVLLYKWNKTIVYGKDCLHLYSIEDFSADEESLFYEMTNSDFTKDSLKLKKYFLIIICFLFNIIILILKKGISIGSCLIVILTYISIGPFFINLQIEPWFFYSEDGIKNELFTEKNFYIDSKIYKHSTTMRKCNIFVCLLNFILFILWVLTAYDFLKPNNNLDTIQNSFNVTNNFTGNSWLYNQDVNNHNVISAVCYTKINHLNFIELTALANAAYLEGEINNEKNIIRALKLSIFNEIDDTINLKNLTFLTNISDIISILKADFTIKGKKPLTIIAIKGTSNWLDFFIDVEMFISSALFSIARQFPVLYKSESYASYFLAKNSLLPYDFLGSITLMKKYIDKIDTTFSELTIKTGYGLNEREYLFIGHSLGGGLAKLSAFKYKMKSFSVSGPGLSPLEFYFGFGKDEFNKYFKSTFIDLVPDLDIVPRVDLSGGSQYRVLCEKGIFECHQAKRTLCMLGVMCNKEHLTGDLCSGIFTSKEYQEDFINVVQSKY